MHTHPLGIWREKQQLGVSYIQVWYMAHNEICLTAGTFSTPLQHLVSRLLEQQSWVIVWSPLLQGSHDHCANVGQTSRLILSTVEFVRSSHNTQNMMGTENRSLQVDKLANEPKRWAPPWHVDHLYHPCDASLALLSPVLNHDHHSVHNLIRFLTWFWRQSDWNVMLTLHPMNCCLTFFKCCHQGDKKTWELLGKGEHEGIRDNKWDFKVK